MKEIKEVEIFKVGPVVDSSGGENNYSLSDLKEMADCYDKSIHEAPIVISHENDKAWHKSLSSKDQLANGWIKKLYVEGESLYCDIEVDDFTYNAIKDGKLKKRSIGHYTRTAKNNPANGKLYLRHLALLGAEPPAVKGLKDIVIYKENNMEEDNNLLEQNAQEWLAFALIDEGNGFNGNIVAFSPEPSEENNWLYDSESEKFEGKFKDDEEQVFDFTIQKDGEDWISSIKMTQETQDALPDEDGEEEIMENPEMGDHDKEEMGEAQLEDHSDHDGVKDPQQPGMSETSSETEEMLLKQIEMMSEKLAEYEAKQKQMMEKEVKVYCDGVYDRGVIDPKKMAKEVFYNLLMMLEEKADMMTYSDGENQVSAAEGVKQILNAIPEQKQFSDAVYSRSGVTKIASPQPNGTPESNELYSKIMMFMEEKGIKNFAEGYRKYKQVN